MGRITVGDLKGARPCAREERPYSRRRGAAGLHVLATEPAAALCLKH